MSKWLYEAVVQRGTNDLYGAAPSDMGSDNVDSILGNDEYGVEDENNLVEDTHYQDSPNGIRQFAKDQGYTEFSDKSVFKPDPHFDFVWLVMDPDRGKGPPRNFRGEVQVGVAVLVRLPGAQPEYPGDTEGSIEEFDDFDEVWKQYGTDESLEEDEDDEDDIYGEDYEEEREGPDGETYIHPGGGDIGWRAGDREGYYSDGGGPLSTSGSTLNYFLTDGNDVVVEEGIMLWDPPQDPEDMYGLWEEWRGAVDPKDPDAPKLNPHRRDPRHRFDRLKEGNFRTKFRSSVAMRHGPDGAQYTFPQEGRYGWRYENGLLYFTDGTDVLEWDEVLPRMEPMQKEMKDFWDEWMSMATNPHVDHGPTLNPQDDQINEMEPIKQPDALRRLRKLGYSPEQIGRIDRSESDTILMHRIPANKSIKKKKKFIPRGRHSDRHESVKEDHPWAERHGRRGEEEDIDCPHCEGTGDGPGPIGATMCNHCGGSGEKDMHKYYTQYEESMKKKEEAYWTEVDENLFTKASMSFGKNFLPDEEEEEEVEEDIDSEPADMYNTRYEDVTFLQGEEAEHVIEIINKDGAEKGIEHLQQWHYPGEHMTRDELPHGKGDNVHESDGYILYWNSSMPYAGLSYDTDRPRPRWTRAADWNG